MEQIVICSGKAGDKEICNLLLLGARFYISHGNTVIGQNEGMNLEASFRLPVNKLNHLYH